MKIRNRYLDKFIAWSAWGLLKALFLTTRVELRLAEDGTACTVPPVGGQRYSYCVWHDAILVALFFRRTYALSALVSRHQDGTYLSDVIQLLGIQTVRGSASRGGAEATRELLNTPERHICITPDGPRGPRREMKDGIVYVASKTDRPVICSAIKVSRAWRIPGGWSDIVLPKPFSRITVLTSRPIVVPEGASREEIAEYRMRVQDEMDRLDAFGERLCQGDESVSDLIHQATHDEGPADSRQAA